MEKLNLRSLKLLVGAHEKREEGLCAMEAVAWLAGEPHSDAPVCACPVVTKYVIGLNDKFSDGERKLLKPYLKRIIGTRDGNAVKRAEILAMNAVTKVAPYAVEIRFPEYAEKMRAATNLKEAKTAAYAANAAAYAYASAADAYADAYADAANAAYAYASAAAADAYADAANAAYASASAAAAAAAADAANAAYASADAASAAAYSAIRSKIIKAALRSLDEILKVK